MTLLVILEAATRGEAPAGAEAEAARRDFILGMANIGVQGARVVVEALDLQGPLLLLDVGDRVSTVAGDYLADELPGGNQLALLSNIIHSLGPEENQALIGRIHRALESGGRLILKDFFVDDEGTGPRWPAVSSINMLVGTENGRSYSEGEVLGWLDRAGFTPGARHAVGSHSMVLVYHRR